MNHKCDVHRYIGKDKFFEALDTEFSVNLSLNIETELFHSKISKFKIILRSAYEVGSLRSQCMHCF